MHCELICQYALSSLLLRRLQVIFQRSQLHLPLKAFNSSALRFAEEAANVEGGGSRLVLGVLIPKIRFLGCKFRVYVIAYTLGTTGLILYRTKRP